MFFFLQTTINATEVGITDRKFQLYVTDIDNYMFGVSVNAITMSGKTISSGFQWNTCIYRKDKSKLPPFVVHF